MSAVTLAKSSASRSAAAMVARLLGILPGLGLCVAVGLVASGGQALQMQFSGRVVLDALVLAILLGTAIRIFWTPSCRHNPGIDISAKLLLEIAVALLGGSVSLQALGHAGSLLLAAVATVVVLALGAGYALGRLCGVAPRLAVLIACGNAICGNSAIAAVAPVIGASASEMASAIAFTALLGVGVVILLPAGVHFLELSPYSGGVLAGLTVYAVPQVLAATAPLGALSLQIGTLVKLVRVLMLGPVVLCVSLAAARGRPPYGRARGAALHRLFPWFIGAFLVLAALNSAGYLAVSLRAPMASVAGGFSIVSMAALGLSVDFGALRRVGLRAACAVIAALASLMALAYVAVTHIPMR